MDRELIMMWIALGTFVILVFRTISSQIVAPIAQQISILTDNIRSLKEIIDEIRSDMANIRERIANNEATTKSLHKRLDRLEGRLDNNE